MLFRSDRDLAAAVRAALALDRVRVAADGARFDWGAATQQFLDALAPIPPPPSPSRARPERLP